MWEDDIKWEMEWWGNCVNSHAEEIKQLVYAQKMGVKQFRTHKTPYNIDLRGAKVLDIGGGPVSLLLKASNPSGCKVVDPLPFPNWVIERYKAAGIDFEQIKAEDLKEKGWDEAWLYNVLQHVENPRKVIENARKSAKIIRIFDWIDTYACPGHPQTVKETQLNEWLHGEGKVEELVVNNEFWGKCYYGIFPT